MSKINRNRCVFLATCLVTLGLTACFHGHKNEPIYVSTPSKPTVSPVEPMSVESQMDIDDSGDDDQQPPSYEDVVNQEDILHEEDDDYDYDIGKGWELTPSPQDDAKEEEFQKRLNRERMDEIVAHELQVDEVIEASKTDF